MIKKYKQFNESLNFPNTEEKIHKVCEKYFIEKYIINNDMSIDVNGTVDLSYISTTYLPLKFNKVNGNFNCYRGNLVSLEGSPIEVDGFFDCHSNHLDSLKGISPIINRFINCQYNMIKSFKDIPEDFQGDLYCKGNPINEIFELFNSDDKCIYWINEYDVIQGDNVILDRLIEVFHQLNKSVPTINKIEGYNLI